jgi:hypothetical protein
MSHKLSYIFIMVPFFAVAGYMIAGKAGALVQGRRVSALGWSASMLLLLVLLVPNLPEPPRRWDTTDGSTAGIADIILIGMSCACAALAHKAPLLFVPRRWRGDAPS